MLHTTADVGAAVGPARQPVTAPHASRGLGDSLGSVLDAIAKHAPATPKNQKVRGMSFVNEYRGLAAARRPGLPEHRQQARCPSMERRQTQFCLPPQAAEDADKIVLVLDLDETLIYAREGPLFARPGLDEFFALVGSACEVVVWTAGLRAYAQAILREIDKGGVVKHLIYRHEKWFTGRAGYRKDLAALGRNLDRTIIIENTPDCIRGYQQNGILVEDYEGGERADNTIPALTTVLRELIRVRGVLSVPQFITHCTILRHGPVQTDLGPIIYAYQLDPQAAHVRAARSATTSSNNNSSSNNNNNNTSGSSSNNNNHNNSVSTGSTDDSGMHGTGGSKPSNALASRDSAVRVKRSNRDLPATGLPAHTTFDFQQQFE